jgi:FtsZ-binding cell division protein ZapB
MSNQLMDTLESKVFSAVDTIELLRSEINGLREERLVLEDKLRELIGKMEGLGQESGAESTESAESDSSDDGTSSSSPFRTNY